jgi:hypothetical protein
VRLADAVDVQLALTRWRIEHRSMRSLTRELRALTRLMGGDVYE